uniref:SUN domain-containing protein n=1 Tax=Clastoptera arizonana TaxID=38151 RepID=A0A1B6D0T8_9HEMI
MPKQDKQHPRWIFQSSVLGTPVRVVETPRCTISSYRLKSTGAISKNTVKSEIKKSSVDSYEIDSIWKPYRIDTKEKRPVLKICRTKNEKTKISDNNIKKLIWLSAFNLLLFLLFVGLYLISISYLPYNNQIEEEGSQNSVDVYRQGNEFQWAMFYFWKNHVELKNLEKKLCVFGSGLAEVKQKLSKAEATAKRYQSIASYQKDVLEDVYGSSADFAAEMSGGRILATPDTETYYPTPGAAMLWGFQIRTRVFSNPSVILKGMLQPGDCWAFHGDVGSVVIKLARPVQVSAVTLEHIPQVLSIHGNIKSAPRHFQLYGTNMSMDSYELLGDFEYHKGGPSRQTFYVDAKQKTLHKYFEAVKMQFLSNYGNHDYTCIYRVRVHGQL